MSRFAFIVAILLLSTFARAALNPGYTAQVFQTQQGLPQHNINAIIQSRDGYLWLGTLGGLVRFDGVRFKVFDTANSPQLQNNRITALFEDGAGVIWIGHETGDLTRLQNGRFEAVAVPGPAIREPILTITTEGQGNVVVFYQSGALRFVESGVLLETGISPEQQRGVATCVRDGSGTIWIMRAGSLSVVSNQKLEPVELDRFTADKTVYGIAAARDGGLWVAGQGKLRKRVGDRWANEFAAIPWRQTFIPSMLEMRNGTLAVATMDQSIYLMTPNSAQIVNRDDGLPSDWVRALCEDHEGNLWVGLGSGGLMVLRPARASRFISTDRWKGRAVLSVAERNGELWVGTDGAGVYRYAKGRWGWFDANDGLANPFVWSIAEVGAKLWMSTAGGRLFEFANNRFVTPAGLDEFSSPVRAILNSKANRAVFMGTHSGLHRYQDGKVERLGGELVAADVRCIVEDTNGVIWFGMFGGGLGRFEGGKAKQFRKADGLSSDFVQSLYLDTDGALWVGTAESGLNRFKDGRFKTISTAQGLRDNVICHIADDGRGYLWISSNAGIMRVAKSALNECADGAIPAVASLSYGETDGLPSAQCSGGLQPTGCRTADGLLWFATTKGLAVIDPANVRTNLLPLVLIEELRVNDTPVLSTNASTVIAPGRQRFDIDYTAISFAAPERALFKYRLEGLQEDWIGPTTARSVSYSYLTPGDYKFRLIACNSDGVWNESGATLAFTVLPFFWQTLMFRIAVVALALAVAGAVAMLIARQRYHRRLELAERQRGIERERARIAQDIHDDLGSSLTRIILLSQSARGDLDSPEIAGADLDRIYDTARNLTRSLDEIVWAVNPRHDTLDSLATYLGKFAQDFLGAAKIRCRLDMPVDLPQWPLSAETRHNVFLAFKEALNNAAKHAQASEVRITLTLEASAFILSVADNGRGLPTVPKEAGTDTEDGLINMKKRLSDVGGLCEIQSAPGAGTRVTFKVPVSPQSS